MKGNPHYNVLARGYAIEDSWDAAIVQTEAAMAIAHEQHTANLIAIYNTQNLYLSDADRIDLEKTILQRAGLKDA